MRKKLQWKLAAIWCLATILLCGCGSKEEEAAEDTVVQTSTEQEQSQEIQEIDLETMELIKYNIYIELNNYVVDVLNNIDSYYLVVNNADEFSMIQDSGYSYGYDITSLSTDILDNAQVVAEMEPAFEELDDMVLQLIDPMRTMMEIFNSISNSKDFADNQYAKAKEYHVTIQENAKYFYSLGVTYMDAVDVLADERVAAEEAQLLADGKLITYNSSHAITIANEIIDECYKQGVTDANIEELELEPVRALYDELVATVEAYNAAVSDSKQLKKESLSNSALFDDLLNKLAEAVEHMIQQSESGKNIEDGSAPSGSINFVYEVIAECIERYNSVFNDR